MALEAVLARLQLILLFVAVISLALGGRMAVASTGAEVAAQGSPSAPEAPADPSAPEAPGGEDSDETEETRDGPEEERPDAHEAFAHHHLGGAPSMTWRAVDIDERLLEGHGDEILRPPQG